jgi:hypothetical protein
MRRRGWGARKCNNQPNKRGATRSEGVIRGRLEEAEVKALVDNRWRNERAVENTTRMGGASNKTR